MKECFDLVRSFVSPGHKNEKGSGRAKSDALPFSFFPPLPLCFPFYFSATVDFLFYFRWQKLRLMFPYENLEVYKKAYNTNQLVYRFLKGNKTIPAYAKDQLGRASLSIMLNIAEGSGKFSNKDRRNFYVIARGSAFECASLVTFLKEEEEVLNDIAVNLLTNYEDISRMLFTMIKNLEE